MSDTSTQDFAAERARLAGDPYRPAYHFVAPSEWLNDPNGAIFWRGRHHLFYQYDPLFTRGGGPKHWAHAVSEDLVHWTDLPVALSPEPGTFDEGGVWSGTTCHGPDDRIAVAIYHAYPTGNAVATSDDDLLLAWRKSPANPVIPADPARVYDPCIWREGDVYYSLSGRITGAGHGDGRDVGRGGHDVAYLFRSRDLEHWDDLGAFYDAGDFARPGEDCAVPDFFPLGGKHVLLFAAHSAGGQYYTGTYAGGGAGAEKPPRFTPEVHRRLNFTTYGADIGKLITAGDLMAPISWEDGAGRRIIIAWVTEGRPWDVQSAAGWAGILTLPRVVTLGEDDAFRMAPAPELEALRAEGRHFEGLDLAAGAEVRLEGADGDCLEIRAVLDPAEADEVGLKVRCSPDGEEETTIAYSREAATLTLDPSRASLSDEMIGREAQVAPLELADGKPLELRVFVDRSVVEVFTNHRRCVVKRIYPSRRDSLGVRAFAAGGRAAARSIDVWPMRSIWPVA